jgi:hypothetical protein
MMPTFFVQILKLAAQVRAPGTAAVFCAVLALIALWVVFKKNDRGMLRFIGTILSVGILFLGSLPILAKTYLDAHGIYEVRVLVMGVDGSPVDNAVVVCSPGGEQKKIAGGWECDIPPRNRPADGLFNVYASVDSAFLTGKGQILLSDDYNPVVKIQLTSDRSALVRGEIKGPNGTVLSGAYVFVVGYDSERMKTGPDGGFALRAHAANGQMLKLHVEAKGFTPYEGLQMAGDTAISIVLGR